MFDFEKLNVYQKSLEYSNDVLGLIKDYPEIDTYIKDQLKRSSLSISANIAEGAGRFTKPDKRNWNYIKKEDIKLNINIVFIYTYHFNYSLFIPFHSFLKIPPRPLKNLIHMSYNKIIVWIIRWSDRRMNTF